MFQSRRMPAEKLLVYSRLSPRAPGPQWVARLLTVGATDLKRWFDLT